MTSSRVMPMFPLNLVLLPGSVLPLRLFEPRYLQLYRDIVGSDREFGVVLIERGRESGGGDIRFDLGCVARMVGSATHEDGTVSIVTVGTARVQVLDWLTDDPYPRARVEVLSEGPVTENGSAFIHDAESLLTKLRALFAELGADVGTDPLRLSQDPIAATYQMAQLAGLQALDLQRVLEAPDSDVRAGLVRELIHDQVELVQLQLGLG